jgi:drug/metabolite transporter (DMT)-like permease
MAAARLKRENPEALCLQLCSHVNMNTKNWGLLFLLSLLWGSSFFFYKILVATLPPVTVVLGRVGIAAVALNLWLLAAGERLPAARATWGRFFISGLLNNVLPFILIAWGETRISSGMASILNATTPIFMVIVAHVLTSDDRMTPGKIMAVIVGFIGVGVLVGPDALAGNSQALGELAVALASCMYAFGAVYTRRFKGLAPLVAATGQLTGATAILLPLSLVIDRPWTFAMPGWAVWASFAVIALANTAFAYFIYYKLLARAGVTFISLCTFIIPPLALVLGALALQEAIALNALIGMGIIALGLAVNDGRLIARLRRGPAAVD